MTLPITGQQLIAGEWQKTTNADFYSVNPRTKNNNEVQFSNASPEEIDRAVKAGAEAFEQVKSFSTERRAIFLETVADEIEALGEQLLNVCDSETGLGLARLTGERGRTTGQLRAFARHIREGSYVEAIIDTALPDRQPAPRVDIRRMLVPIGVVAVFPPNNFPFAFGIAGGDTASAFAAGCPVIAKGHPGHPATNELVAQAIQRALTKCDFPQGFFSLIQGNQIAVGQNLVQHPLLSAVGFTGSLRGGRAIFDTASKRPIPIPVYAEMGSINPVVIMPDALKTRYDSLVTGLVGSVTLGSGQFCTNPGLILMLDSEETRQFVQDVAGGMKAQTPTVLLNEGVESGLSAGIENIKQKDTITILAGGEVAHEDGFCYANTVMQTTAEAFLSDSTLQQEHFGPVTLFVLCDSQDELNNVIDGLEGNLTATVHATESELEGAGDLFTRLQAHVGRLILNGFPTGVEVVHSMVHGGPYPATTVSNSTSVGMTAIQRFLRPVAFQNMPDALLPDALKNDNPLNIWRIVDNEHTKQAIE